MIYKEGNCKKGERKRDLIIKEKKVLLGRMKEESGVKRDHLSKLNTKSKTYQGGVADRSFFREE